MAVISGRDLEREVREHWLNNELHNEGHPHCKSSLFNNEAFELIVGTMSPAHCAIGHNEANCRANSSFNYLKRIKNAVDAFLIPDKDLHSA